MKFTMSHYHDLRAQLATATTTEPRDVRKVETVLARVEAEIEAREVVAAMLEARILAPDPNVRRTAEEQTISDHAEDDAKTLRRGTWGNGYWAPELRDFADGPSIDALARLAAECRAVLEEEATRKTLTWPREFEYCGLPGRAELDGQLLRVGDRVLLTEGQAAAWSDRFRAVEASEEQAVS